MAIMMVVLAKDYYKILERCAALEEMAIVKVRVENGGSCDLNYCAFCGIGAKITETIEHEPDCTFVSYLKRYKQN